MANNVNNTPPASYDYGKTYKSFSGQDMVCVFEIPLSSTRSVSSIVGSVQDISYSIHNEKMPVRVLGNMNMKNIVFGNRTIAGTIVFTVFDRHWLKKLINEYMYEKDIIARTLSDEIPPINITISMANEYGQKAKLSIYGVTFVNEGQTMSVNDMYTENTFEYFAQDIDYLDSSKTSSNSNKNNVKSNNITYTHTNEFSKQPKNTANKESPVDILDKAEYDYDDRPYRINNKHRLYISSKTPN